MRAKKIFIAIAIYSLWITMVFAKEYASTSYYIAYDDNDNTQYALVMPSVKKIYTHKAGNITELKQIDMQFATFPTYDNGELCFSALKSSDDSENGASVMAGNCYDVKFFYTQKEKIAAGTAFTLYYAPADKLYEGLAGKADTFKVVKEGEHIYAANSLTHEDYTYFRFDAAAASVIVGEESVDSNVYHQVSNIAEFREALEDAAINGSNDVIILDKGVYDANSDGEGTFTFADTEEYNLTIKAKEGLRREEVVLDGNDTVGVLNITMRSPKSVVMLDTITVRNGASNTIETIRNAGGITSSNSIYLKNVHISGCSGGSAGALTVRGNNMIREEYFLRIEDSNISKNYSGGSSTSAALMASNIAKVDITGTVFDANKAYYLGTQILNFIGTENISIKNSKILNNYSQGGVLYTGDQYCYIESTDIINNDVGGHIFVGYTFRIYDSLFERNKTGYYGTLITGLEQDIGQESLLIRNRFIDNSSQQRSLVVLKRALLINNLFQKNFSKDLNNGLINIANGYIINNTFYQNTHKSSSVNGVLMYGGSFVANNIFNDTEDTNAIIFKANSNIYNSYIDYGKIIYNDHIVIKKHNKKPSSGDIAMSDEGKLMTGSVSIDTGLNPSDVTFKELVDNDTYYEIITEALQTDLEGNPRIKNGTIDMGAFEF